MKQTLKETSLALALLSATLASASAATNLLPQLAIKSMGPAEVGLYWPASASDFVLEETRELTAFGLWRPVAPEPVLSGQDFTLSLPSAEHARFFRLRYQPSALRSSNPAISFAFGTPDGTNIVVGQPFAVEVRASFNALLAAAAVRLSASGSAEAMLTGRSADPAQLNGLMFVSATSQQPFESGLPASLGGKGSLEVLLGIGTWPFDGVQPGEDVLLERLEITPMTSGELTVSLAAVEAVTSRWARDGVPFETVSLDPWRSTVRVQVEGAVKPAGLGKSADFGPAVASAVVSSLRNGGSFRLPAQAAPTVSPNADRQGAVDLADLVYVRARLGLDPALPANAGADVNQDQQIDLLDLMAVRNRFTPTTGFGAPPAPRLTEVFPNPATGQAPWVELSYPRRVEPYYYALELRNGAQDVLLASWPEAISMWPPYIVIVFDGEAPLEYLGNPDAPTAVRVHVPMPATVFIPTNDQCRLYLDGQLLDAVAWGDQPERNAALNTGIFPIPLGGSIGRDGLEQERWVRFAQPTPGADNGLPTPLACFPFDGAGVLKAETTQFSWVDPRYSPVAYEIEVDDAQDFQTPLIRTTCYQPSHTHSPGLAAGSYYWRLRAQAGEVAGVWSPVWRFDVLDLEPPLESGRKAPQRATKLAGSGAGAGMVGHFYWPTYEFASPHKDTSMLCLECDRDKGDHAWDRPHTAQSICPHEIGHAGAAIAFEMCEYYRGLRWPPLFQDEINLEIFQTPTGGPEGELGHGQAVDLGKALEVALAPKLVLPYYFNPHQDPGTWDNLKETIDRQIPFVGQFTLKTGVGTGPVLIIGYFDSLVDPKLRRLVALSPFSGGGKFIFSINDLSATAPTVYVPADPPGSGQPPDGGAPEVHADTDGDGLCDFDEEMRFPTERTKRDSDGDGIPDKTEIWSYKFGKGWVPRTPDPDGDGLRAEIDPDSDEDGCPDGAEDRNRNGTLFDISLIQVEGGYVGIKSKDAEETDPFSLDEFKLTLTAKQTPLHFREGTRLEVKVTDKEDRAVKDAQVQFKMEPLIASFDASGGAPVITAFALTDKDGKASTDFCAQETEGLVTVEALYKPCPKSKESKTELKIQILPYDWIFAVQEKAVLTGPVLTNEYTVRIDTMDTTWKLGTGIQQVYKDPGFQKVSGYFFHPKTPTPGLYIDEIKVPSALGVLRIDGTNVNGSTWTRMSTNDLPSRWEVAVASPGLKQFPRYLEVRTRGGSARRTALLWWESCFNSGLRQKQYRQTRVADRDLAFLLSFNRYSHTYRFFFGDGNEEGFDPAYWLPREQTWPAVEHTAVSFIPVAGISGYDLGATDASGWPDDWINKSGVYEAYANFYAWKNGVSWTPPAPWMSTEITPQVYDLQKDLTDAGPLPREEFLNTIRFRRDYIGNELKELERRKLDPPKYEIRMLPGE